MQIAVLLHDIRSAHNVGSIFRTCDAAGVSHVFLSGYTPQPIDRFGREQKEIAKTALGAQKSLAWEYAADPLLFIERLKGEGWQILGLEQDARAVDYRSFAPKASILLVLGNEVDGVAPDLRDRCDALIEIPMHGEKESLNVSVATGVALFKLSELIGD